jgi:threonine dehydratase
MEKKLKKYLMNKFDSLKIGESNFIFLEAAKHRVLTRKLEEVFRPVNFVEDSVFGVKAASLTEQLGGSYKIYPIGMEALYMNRQYGTVDFIMASPGNGGRALANISVKMRFNAEIVVPIQTTRKKIQVLLKLGAKVRKEGGSFDESFDIAKKIAEREYEKHFVHPYDADHVMIGNGIIAYELVDFIEEQGIEIVVLPIGGGGLAGGVTAVLKQKNPKLKIIGVQAERNTAMIDSVQGGRILTRKAVQSISYSTAVGNPGEMGFEILNDGIDELITVSEDSIFKAMNHYEKAGKIVEGAGALTMAAIIEGKVFAGGKTLIFVSGANR